VGRHLVPYPYVWYMESRCAMMVTNARNFKFLSTTMGQVYGATMAVVEASGVSHGVVVAVLSSCCKERIGGKYI